MTYQNLALACVIYLYIKYIIFVFVAYNYFTDIICVVRVWRAACADPGRVAPARAVCRLTRAHPSLASSVLSSSTARSASRGRPDVRLFSGEVKIKLLHAMSRM